MFCGYVLRALFDVSPLLVCRNRDEQVQAMFDRLKQNYQQHLDNSLGDTNAMVRPRHVLFLTVTYTRISNAVRTGRGSGITANRHPLPMLRFLALRSVHVPAERILHN